MFSWKNIFGNVTTLFGSDNLDLSNCLDLTTGGSNPLTNNQPTPVVLPGQKPHFIPKIDRGQCGAGLLRGFSNLLNFALEIDLICGESGACDTKSSFRRVKKSTTFFLNILTPAAAWVQKKNQSKLVWL